MQRTGLCHLCLVKAMQTDEIADRNNLLDLNTFRGVCAALFPETVLLSAACFVAVYSFAEDPSE